MSESQEIIKDNLQSLEPEVNHEHKKADVIGELFEERDRFPTESTDAPDPNPKATNTQKNALKQQPEEKQDSAPHTKENNKKEVDDTSSSFEKLKSDLEKTQKLMKETQRWGTKNSIKVKEASKSLKSLIATGALSEEEARDVLSVLQSEMDEEEEMSLSASQHPFSSLFQIANRELEHIRKYTEDDLLQEKIEAFDFLLSVSSKKEAEEILETLADLEDDPVKLTRKMLSLGQEAYESSYKAIKQAGGIKDYLAVQSNEIEKLEKKIDKLEKKLSQYEDYDKPSYRIAGTSDINEKSSSRDVIGSLFEERDRPRQVAR